MSSKIGCNTSLGSLRRQGIIAATAVIMLTGLSVTASAAPVRMSVGPTVSAAPTTDRYIALGDSFSAGEGNPPFDPGTNVRKPGTQPYDLCHRSSAAYPKVLSKKYGWSLAPEGFVACSGAEVDNIVDGFPEQHEGTQLNKLDETTSAVTISVGGNDMEFSSILAHCIWGPGSKGVSDCAHHNFDGKNPDDRAKTLRQELTQDMTCSPQLMNKKWQEGDRCDVSLDVTNGNKTGSHTVPSLHELYKMIENAAPYAHLYVLLYPHLFANVSNKNISNSNVCDVVTGAMSGTFNPFNPSSWNIDASDMKWLNSQVDLLDDVIASEAKAAGGQISVIDPRPLWNGTSGKGHGLCGSGSSWLNGLILAGNKWGAGPDQESFHPNAAGQKAFAQSFPTRTPPSAPQNLTVSVSGNVAQVSWQPPANGGQAAFVGYELDWDTGTATAVQHLTADQTSMTLTGLSPGAHAISVFAINTVGTSPPATSSAVIGSESGGSGYQSAVLSDHPVAFWPLDDPSGSTTARDATGGPSGTTECGATLGTAPGPISGTTALRLDGSTCSDVNVGADYPALTQVTGAMTIEVWARTDVVSDASTLPYLLEVGQWNNVGYGMEWGGSTLYADFGQGTTGGGWATSDPGTWHQLVFTYDPQTDVYTAYADGTVQYTQTIGPLDPNTFDSAGGALIGRQARNVLGDGYAPFTGDVANVSIYNYALSPAQISSHYAAAEGS